MLAPDEIYLNAGTFSALPRPVYDALIRHIAEAEANPTRVAAANRLKPMWSAQADIAEYVGAPPEDILFHINVTHALNQALFGMRWPGRGEMLVSDLEYGAIVNAACEAARRSGLTVRRFALPRQPAGAEDLADAVLDAVSGDTVGLLISHVVSATGMVVPVERLAPRLRERGVRLVVDGAHGPGLVPLRLGETQIDFYGGNLHKWFMGPKGTAFLYVAPELHQQMQPQVVGWGGVELAPARFRAHDANGTRQPFQHVFQLQGLHDASPFLALKATLDFRAAVGEENILGRIAELAAYARQRLCGDLGLEAASPDRGISAGLVACRVPAPYKGRELAEELFRRHRITAVAWEEKPGVHMLRVSAHIWNSPAHIDRLAEAVAELRG